MKHAFLFSIQLLPEKFHVLRRIEGDIITNAHLSSCKVLLITVKF